MWEFRAGVSRYSSRLSGICTRRTGGAWYVPDFRAVEQSLQVALQVTLVIFRTHAVNAHGTVPAGPSVRFFQPVKVHQIGQRSERHLRRLFRQRCYPFLFR